MPANHKIPHTEEAKAKMSAARLGKPAPWRHRKMRVVDGIEQFQCGTCKGFFPRDGFYANKRTLLGIKSQCKKCHNQATIKSRDADRTRNANREYMRRARVVNAKKIREREALRVRPITVQRRARQLLNQAVQRGYLSRPAACSRCGRSDLRIEGHHYDYSEPLAVTWLCTECHGKEHRHA